MLSLVKNKEVEAIKRVKSYIRTQLAESRVFIGDRFSTEKNMIQDVIKQSGDIYVDARIIDRELNHNIILSFVVCKKGIKIGMTDNFGDTGWYDVDPGIFWIALLTIVD